MANVIQGYAEKISGTTGVASEIVGAVGAGLVGGTASVLGGGKFSNGAQTAALQYLFNQILSDEEVSKEMERTEEKTQQQSMGSGSDGTKLSKNQ